MFVIVLLLRARVGEADALIALHEDWQRHLRSKNHRYISGELLTIAQGSREFISIMRFEGRKCAQVCVNSPVYQMWYERVASLAESIPEVSEHSLKWNSPTSLVLLG
jgi:hypothetical protein